jgi:2-polyprenyl-3-methyl-5-hydroxy-6-metoxy-1,4-benzoquinol methylase
MGAMGGGLLALQGTGESPELFLEARDALLRLRAVEINLELTKGELEAFRGALDDLGRAIAPGAGLEGVPTRFAELRERVNAMDRRIRQLSSTAAPPPPSAPAVAGEPAPPAPAPSSAGGFDYVGFEHRFRGDSAAILESLTDRYLDLLRKHQPVLDVGCGRGELLAALREHGVAGEGVEPDEGMAEEARARGLTVHATDAVTFLRSQPEGRFGAITTIHVVEHLQLPDLVEFLELSASRLRPGGVLVAETPNPSSLIVLGNSYILDPTHVWPLHPSLLTFLCERAGFRDVRLEFHEPARAYHLAPIDAGPDAPPWIEDLNQRLAHLNDVLFGPQEFAAIATTPA